MFLFFQPFRLTAYAVKIYCKATEFVPAVDNNFICNGIRWLLAWQNADGSFQSVEQTAYVMIAIFECTCADLNLVS